MENIAHCAIAVENTTQKSTYNNNYWTQIASQHALTQVQRPAVQAYSSHHTTRLHTNRRPPQPQPPQPPPRTNIVTVKHGIFPIHKTRRRPRLFHPLSFFY